MSDNRLVSCPRCRGVGVERTAHQHGPIWGQHRFTYTENVCPTCHGHRSIHPLKSRLYEIQRDAAHNLRTTGHA